ncbi:MAG: chemotaxis protein CheB, partial [Terriglobales bacterium]
MPEKNSIVGYRDYRWWWMSYDLIIIGCSLGGLKALQRVLPAIGLGCRIPVVIVQH